MSTPAPKVPHRHFAEVESTMETARGEAAPGEFLLVTAEAQTAGRGTRGRPWHSPRGNVYFTLAVPRAAMPSARLRLFPLECGVALWEAAAALLPPQSLPRLRLKWPNDLLWEGRKAAGMLLEASAEHVFVGVGVNVAEAPQVTDGGTPSGRLADAGMGEDGGFPLALGFSGFLREPPFAGRTPDDGVLVAWRARAAWDTPFILRDRPDRPPVRAMDVNADGHLRVRHDDGREEWLVSEYLA